MAAASLQTRVFYGLQTDIVGNAHYITDTEILYPVGNVLAVHNFAQRDQKLIRLPDKHRINVICVSPNKRYVALSEVGEKPAISIYDIASLKRRKLLGIPFEATGVTRFSCMAFTHDSKNLAAITGEPEQTMLFYNWEKGKVESTYKVAIPQNPLAIAEMIACNPAESAVMAFGGSYIFKFLTIAETVWRSYGFAKADNLLICSMAWLNADRLLAGTKDGRVLYLENGDLKNIYQISETVSMNLKIREEYVMPADQSSQVTPELRDNAWEQHVRCLLAFPRGFVYALGVGTIVLFEKEGKHKYTKRNIYCVPVQAWSQKDAPDLYRINTINVNISYDHLIITSGWSQLFHVTLWGPDLNMDPEPQQLNIMGQPLHHGPIGDLSVCAWKSVFMTFGEYDRSVRLWDFETESLIMLKQYAEEICGIAMHPMGLFCLIGFSDKLRFMTILIDDLLPMHEFAIRSCRTVCFSHGGHMFAAVNGNVVQVYTTIGFYNPFILKGHTGKVKALLWSQMDLKMLSMGTEGAIYEWDMATGTRSGEIILKGLNLRDLVLSSDMSYTYCIAHDDRIREIRYNAVLRDFKLVGKEMHHMIMGKDDLSIFVTCPGGVILSLKTPLQSTIESIDFHLHSVDVMKIALSHNENYLISVARDGSLCVWKLYYAEGKVVKIGRELPYTDEVLIGKEDLQDKINTIKGLTVRIRELETEHAYKLRQIDVLHGDKLRDVHRGYCEAIKELRDRIEKLQEDHINEINNINVEIVKMKNAHEQATQRMENSYEAKLITEYDRYQAFEEHTNAMRQDYERQLANLEKRDAEELQSVVTKYEALVHEKKLQLEETSDEMAHKEQVHGHLVAQIEDDADREILEIRTNYESLLQEERQSNLKLKGEAGVMRNRFMAGQKDVEDLRRQVSRVQTEYAQFHKNIQDLEKQLVEMKKEIDERDATILDKEQQVYDTLRANQELEKYKFVLTHKVQELEGQIEPRNREIQQLNEEIRNTGIELKSYHETEASLKLELRETREKLRAARQEVDSEVHKSRRCQRLVRRIRTDILDTAVQEEPSALRTAVTSLYHKYSAAEQFLRSRKADVDAECEFKKQRELLERTVASLQRQVSKDTSVGEKDLERMTEESSVLIVELNALREQLKEAREYISRMESMLGLTRMDARSAEAKEAMQQAYQGYEKVREKYTAQMREYQQIILALKEDVTRLLSRLSSEEVKGRKRSL
ncbi:PREDICTED: cilia- and flagella-associated protein 57 [Dinoponera quadriceps]|uniref:Cilia- and flagella-associated protein 57 n=1 Tax=Dinoponera quadriceps TaxID=609295 RepID=A0A6P3XKU9_DINQU|nr:PREDICTED: cilia- and flagella-associated protein 57 [Dinoponera quadriceps]